MHALQEGEVVEISEPKNHFPLDNEARHSILVAGGIGITPILCMAERLSHIDASFELHYCTRSAERTAFKERLEQDHLKEFSRVYHDTQPAEERLDIAKLVANPAPDRHLYVCGPSGFIDVVLNAAKAAGWAESNLHREYFTGAIQDTANDGSFQVRLASSGQVIDIPADKTIVEALEEQGIDVPVSCEQGVCGTCLTRVLEGEPDHRDLYLTDADRKSVV